MARIEAETHVKVEDDMSRFISSVKLGITEAVEEAVKRGAQASRNAAPVGVKKDPRAPHLKDSIESEMVSATLGRWFSTARHAMPVEEGGAAHEQTGYVNFFWERENRDWEAGDNMIQHPATPAQPFMRAGYDDVRREIIEIVREHMP